MDFLKITTNPIESIEKELIKLNIASTNDTYIFWIGQAGFLIKFKTNLIIIDPYLSDFLSKKYKGKIFPHIRLMAPPINSESIKSLNYSFCTHAHSDHLDPETISILSKNNPECKFIIPAAEKEEAVKRGINREQILTINAGQSIQLDDDIEVLAIAASHEKFKINERKEHHFLGYILNLNGVSIYHSGDCIPYKGLYNKLKKLKIDIALLPINGRDEYRLSNGIVGNFKIPEVLDLCKKAKIPNLIVHHFGMFAYNTVSEEELHKLKHFDSPYLRVIVPKISNLYRIEIN
jgi:L-ascorbate metabolism protein UlaG (beta-lactamase superfamily)